MAVALALLVGGCSTGPSAQAPGASGPTVPSGAATSGSSTPGATEPPQPTSTWAVTTLPLPNGQPPCADDGGQLQNLRVVAFGAGLVALGSCAHTTSPSLIWSSPDGHIWQAIAPSTLAHADVYVLVGAQGLLVAAGQDTTNGFAAASWVSRDGTTWTRSTGDLGCGVIGTVASTGSGFIAFGNKAPSVPEAPGPQGVCEWISPDGLAWQRVAIDTSVVPATSGVSSVAAGNGRLIATGSHAGPTQALADLWQSSDGRTWTSVDAGPMAGWTSADVALAGGPRFVVVGTDARGNVALAISADGTTWTVTPAPIQGTLTGGPSADAGATGFVLAGVPVNAAASAPAAAWRSTDGVHWTATPTPPGGISYLSVAAVGAALVLAGATPDGEAAIARLGQ